MGVRPAESAFIGSYATKVDAKGRIALPAEFRRALDPKRLNGFYAMPSPNFPGRLDCGGPEFAEKTEKRIKKKFTPYSKEYNAFKAVLMDQMRPVQLDADGRFILPALLKEKANIKDGAFFVGRYDTFQIRNAPDSQEQMRESEAIVMELAHLLSDDDEEEEAA